jgi:pyrroloquinoline quinone (PQQ) biosynthesis protein C
MNPKTSKWMREHARYDDEHPKVALEIIKQYATTERLQKRVMLAAKRSLQLLDLAFNTAYRAYSFSANAEYDVTIDMRNDERRKQDQPTHFPERRFGERRGRVLRNVA